MSDISIRAINNAFFENLKIFEITKNGVCAITCVTSEFLAAGGKPEDTINRSEHE